MHLTKILSRRDAHAWLLFLINPKFLPDPSLIRTRVRVYRHSFSQKFDKIAGFTDSPYIY